MIRCTSAIAILAIAAAAYAAPVGPGETVVVDDDGFATPTGDVVAQNSQPVVFNWIPQPGWTFADGETSTLPGTLNQTVYRDPDTQNLTFLYGFEYDSTRNPNVGIEGGSVTFSSFSSFTTDFAANIDGGSVTRSANGNTLTLNLPGQGTGGVGAYTVATNATNFDSNGTLDVVGTNEFVLIDPGGNVHNLQLLNATLNLTGVYQPGAAPPPPPVIPLPPAVWTGLLTLMSAGAYIRLRRPCAG